MLRNTIIAVCAFILVAALSVLFLPQAIELFNERELAFLSPVSSDGESGAGLRTKADDELRVHYIDVGQGDSIFIELPGGKTMLIDAGEAEKGTLVTNYIKDAGYSKIDTVIVSHAHSDHMGGMSEVLSNFDIGRIYMPKATNNTSSYENLLNIISDKGLKVKTAKAGVSVMKEDDLTIDIIAPVKEYEELNNSSAVVMIKYFDVKFLFMADAEKESEADITANVECDVVKVGHHGSSTSSSNAFVKKTKARYAVISVGEGNDYGHPKQKILDRWQNAGAEILRTDKSGTIVMTTDGKNIEVTCPFTPEYAADDDGTSYVLNTNTMKIHRKDCPLIADIKESNYAETKKSFDELIAQGYTPCGECAPDK